MVKAGVAMFVLDVLVAAAGWAAVMFFVVFGRDGGWPASDPWVVPALAYPLATLLFLYAFGLYRRDATVDIRRAVGRLPLVVTFGAATGFVVDWGLPFLLSYHSGRTDHSLMFGLSIVCFGVSGVIARALFRILRTNRLLRQHLLIVGAGSRAWDLAWMLRKEGRHLSYDITFVHSPAFGPLDQRLEEGGNISVLPDGGSLLDEARRVGASEIVVAPDERRGMDLEALLACKTQGFPVVTYLSFVEREIRRVDLKRMELSWVLYSDGFQFSLIDRVLKRVLDLTASVLILTLLSPLLIGGMLAVAIDDGLPVFYTQVRVTRHGRHFKICKLRTMRRDAERNGAVWAAKADSRITRVGRFLRRTRLDEVPQLFNVLSGDMSLVGPRPERPQFVAELAQVLPLYNQRHMVKAGLSGWAQVNYPYGASVDDARSKLSYDLYYVKNFSVRFDVTVILQTLRVVFWPSGVR